MEYTVPKVFAESLIITRLEGRTPVHPRARTAGVKPLPAIKPRCGFTWVVTYTGWRSGWKGRLPRVTPVAVIYQATWPEARPSAVPSRTSATKYATRDPQTALILVGPPDEYHQKLYAADFSHGFVKPESIALFA